MDLALDGLAIGRLRDALVDAFPTTARLAEFVRIRLNTNLDAVAEGNLAERAFSLLTEWAEPSARLCYVIRQARRHAPNNPPLRAFERDYLTSFTTEHLVALEAAARGTAVARERLIQLASASLPPEWVFPRETENESREATFSRLIDSVSLGSRQSRGGLFPLHDFVERLAREAPGAAPAADLRAWIAATNGAPGRSADPRAVPAVERLVLFLKCDSGDKPAVEPSDPVEITGWLWEIGMDGEPIAKVPTRKIPPTQLRLEQLPALLSDLRKRDKLGKRLVQVGSRMTVELCLRDNLLAAAVDRWMLQLGEDEEAAIGEMYPVVVRSFDRIYHDEWNVREHWKPNWDRLKALSTAAPPPIAWLCDRSAAADKALAARIRGAEIVCAALCVVPDARLLSRCVSAGAPALIWARRPSDVASTRAALEPLLCGALAGLQARVHEERRRGAGVDDHLGRHLTLLWDDFDRLPPDAEDIDFEAPLEG